MAKLLVIRLSAIGDVLLTTPVVRALHNAGHEVHVLTQPALVTLWENNPYVQRVWAANAYRDIPMLDGILDLQMNRKSKQIIAALPPTRITRFDKKNTAKWLAVNLKWKDKLPQVHVVDRYMEAAIPWAAQYDGQGLDFFNIETQGLDDSFLAKHSQYVAVAIGAQHETKSIPESVLIHILNKLQKPVILLGGPADVEKGQRIGVSLDIPHVMVAGKTSLAQSAAYIQSAQVVLSADTGLMHLAAALKKPVVSLWGSTIPEFGMYPLYPEQYPAYPRFEVAIRCRPCSKIGFSSCPAVHFNCMHQQPVADIVAALHSFF